MRYRHKQLHNPHKNAQVLPEHIVEQRLQGAQLANPTPPLSAGAIEAKQLIEKAQQLKGNTMPDLNTALREALEKNKREKLHNTLNAWEQDEKDTQQEKPMETTKQHLFGITNNVTRATFNHVRDNPGITSTQLVAALSQFNRTSVHSLAAQFLSQKQFSRDANGGLHTIVPEYKPLKSTLKVRRELAAKKQLEQAPEATTSRKIVVVKRRTAKDAEDAHNANVAGIGALTVNTDARAVGALPALGAPYQGFNPSAIINSLNVMQARELYDTLKKIFGG